MNCRAFTSSLLTSLVFLLSRDTEAYTAVDDWCIDDVTSYDSYQSALDYVKTNTIRQLELQTIINGAFARAGCYWQQMTSSANITCSGCLNASDIYTYYFQLSANTSLTETQFQNVSLVLLTFIYHMPSSCSLSNRLEWPSVSYSYFVDQLMAVPDVDSSQANSVTLFTDNQLERIMRTISNSYLPGDGPASNKNTTRSDDVDTLCAVGNTKSFSSKDVMNVTSQSTSSNGLFQNELGIMSSVIITKLLRGECITPIYENQPASSHFIKSIQSTFGSADSCSFDVASLERLLRTVGNIASEQHDSHHRRRRDLIADQNTTAASADINSTCLSVDAILASYNIAPTVITRLDFHKLCPALLQQAAIGCKNVAVNPSEFNSPQLTTAQIYGYGTVAVAIVSLFPMLALFVVRLRHKSYYKYLLVLMLGLGVGSLAGDALLHLIPEALGANDHDTSSSSGITVSPSVWKMLTSCLSVWLFFVVQISLQWIEVAIKKRRRTTRDILPSPPRSSSAISMDTVSEIIPNDLSEVAAEDTNERNHSIGSSSVVNQSSPTHVHSSVAWMTTVGDALHNFTDGLAIGASFSKNLATGLGTSIAVLCHEIPHEFGDISILLSAGWSTKKVAIFHIISQFTAFVGLYVGLSISTASSSAEEWILATAAGLFLYVALTDVLPEILACFDRYRPLPVFIASNVGILLGFLILLLLAIFEDKIVIG